MFEKIVIRGFSKHRKIVIRFSTRITTLIGESFAGKTGAVRALKWVTRNKPKGESFINWSLDRCSVNLFFDNKKLTRKKNRSGSTNLYRYKGQDYTAFRNDVPQAIANDLNLSDINFQGSRESDFWFRNTAGEVSRQLNSIVNLDIIDSTLSNVTSEIKKTKMEIEISTAKIKKLKKMKKGLAYGKAADRELSVLESCGQHITQTGRKTLKMGALLDMAVIHQKGRENAVASARDATIIVSEGDLWQGFAKKRDGLKRLLKSGKRLTQILTDQPPSIEHLEKLFVQINKRNELVKKLRVMIKLVVKFKEKKCQTKKELRISKRVLERAVGETCPLCGTVTK